MRNAINRLLLGAGVSLAFTTPAFAAPVDLSSWIAEGGGIWTLEGGANGVIQNENGPRTVFHNNTNSQGQALSGTIEVQTASDDDYVGFVLGYTAGDFLSSAADFWLIDWKQGTQTFSGNEALAGLSLNHVTGDVGNAPDNPDFWSHTGVVNEVARGTNLGSTGWDDNTEYTFDLTFTSSLIEVFVNDTLEISYSGSFSDGAFGFYNYSQANVRYAGLEEVQLPPDPDQPPTGTLPTPSVAWLFLSGLAAIGVFRRRRHA